MHQKTADTPAPSKIEQRQLIVVIVIQLAVITVLFFFAASPGI